MKLFKKILFIIVLMSISIGFWGGLVYHPKDFLVILSAVITYFVMTGVYNILKSKK